MKHTEESKKKLSEARRRYLSENPDKHPWKSSDKFVSKPCEHLKGILRENGISFIEEYSPLEERHFSVDIAFPDQKVAIEVNGNQHYKGGKLNPYYQERHDLIEEKGWVVIELPYLCVYNEELVEELILDLKSNYALGLRDYSGYIKVKTEKKCKDCKFPIFRTSERCRECNKAFRKESLDTRKVDRPSKEVLEKEIESNSWSALGKKYSVSDTAVRKWAKSYGIEIKARQRKDVKPVYCSCGKELYKYRKGGRPSTGLCRECYDSSVSLDIPKKDLEGKVKEGRSLRSIARDYGTTHNTIVRYCFNYGITKEAS